MSTMLKKYIVEINWGKIKLYEGYSFEEAKLVMNVNKDIISGSDEKSLDKFLLKLIVIEEEVYEDL